MREWAGSLVCGRVRLVPTGHTIRVNAIYPYYIDTPLLDQALPEVRQGWIKGTVMDRLGQPEEVAKAFSFIAFDDSLCCTGTEMVLVGGVMACSKLKSNQK